MEPLLNAPEIWWYSLKYSFTLWNYPWDFLKHSWDPWSGSANPMRTPKTTWDLLKCLWVLMWSSEMPLRSSGTPLNRQNRPWDSLKCLWNPLKYPWGPWGLWEPLKTSRDDPEIPWIVPEILWNFLGAPWKASLRPHGPHPETLPKPLEAPLRLLVASLKCPWNAATTYLRSPL